jgi:uncharacterized membrane protein YoaK (UPF0700 family)
MGEATIHGEERPLPRTMPVLLSFVAGYVDSLTYLGLFGLFAAQVTGSFVIAGAEFVTSDFGIAGKLLAIVAFMAAAAATAAIIALTRNAGQATLPWMLGLEASLLALFTATAVFGSPIEDARDWRGIVAGLFAAMAMGAQSVLVRLLMKDVPQTNVMTGNITQLSIAITDIIAARRRFARSRHDAAAILEFDKVRERLLTLLSITLGFMAGAASGAAAFATTGFRGAFIAVAIVAVLALWAATRERS